MKFILPNCVNDHHSNKKFLHLLDRKRIITKNNTLSIPNKLHGLKIFEIKGLLIKCLKAYNKLNLILNKVNLSKLSKYQWMKLKNEIETLKSHIESQLLILHTNKLKDIKITLVKRLKRRQREKRAKLFHKKQKEMKASLKKEFFEQIDLKEKENLEKIYNQKKAEIMKEDFNCFLSDISRKNQECKKHIRLMETLKKLIQARAHTKTTRGEKINTLEKNNTLEIIEDILSLWNSKSNHFEAQNKEINEMLTNSHLKKNQDNETHQESFELSWEKAFFKEEFENNLNCEDLINIRTSWDSYLTSNSMPDYQIPFGWIPPNPPSNSKWREFLMNQNETELTKNE